MPAAASVGVWTLVLLLCDTLAFFSIPSQERVHVVLSLPTWLEVGSALLLMAEGNCAPTREVHTDERLSERWGAYAQDVMTPLPLEARSKRAHPLHLVDRIPPPSCQRPFALSSDSPGYSVLHKLLSFWNLGTPTRRCV